MDAVSEQINVTTMRVWDLFVIYFAGAASGMTASSMARNMRTQGNAKTLSARGCSLFLRIEKNQYQCEPLLRSLPSQPHRRRHVRFLDSVRDVVLALTGANGTQNRYTNDLLTV